MRMFFKILNLLCVIHDTQVVVWEGCVVLLCNIVLEIARIEMEKRKRLRVMQSENV